MKRVLFAAVCLALPTAGLASSPFLVGVWGGEHAGIAFQGGLAELKFDCASGSIDEPVYPAKDGTFSARGTFRTGSMGPIKVGQIFHSQPATYSGNVKKHVMTLSIELEDGTTTGPFTLNENAPPQLTRCL